jgi:hypothetical protein
MSKPLLKFTDPESPINGRFSIIPIPFKTNKFKLVRWGIGSTKHEELGYFPTKLAATNRAKELINNQP